MDTVPLPDINPTELNDEAVIFLFWRKSSGISVRRHITWRRLFVNFPLPPENNRTFKLVTTVSYILPTHSSQPPSHYILFNICRIANGDNKQQTRWPITEQRKRNSAKCTRLWLPHIRTRISSIAINSKNRSCIWKSKETRSSSSCLVKTYTEN
jgi:hypothetical protein